MIAPPNEGYFHWLVSLTELRLSQDPRKSYWSLLHQLHTKPFRWYVHNDDNRGEDGKELRAEYQDAFDIHDEDLWPDMHASVLEVLIALSRRLSFESYGTPGEWFWKLLENLAIVNYSDAHYNHHVELEVNHVLEVMLNRRYAPDGQGGLFPLRQAERDQRRVELWYQMSSYLLEGEFVANGP